MVDLIILEQGQAPGLALETLRMATLAKFPHAFERVVVAAGDTFDWHRAVKPMRYDIAENYFADRLNRTDVDRSAAASTVINHCIAQGWTPEETFAALWAHEDAPVMGHYGDDEGRLRADVRRLWTKPNPNDPSEKFKAIIEAWRAEHPNATAEETAAYTATLNQSRWNFTKPSEDASQPPLSYWDDHRGARGKGMLPKVIGGCSVIVWGKKSSHKSGLLIKECLDAALGKGARVLYLACEGAHGIMTSRLPAACGQRGIGIEAIDDLWRTFPASPGLMNDAEIDELIARCREEGFEPDIIVIDTLTRAVAGFDINAPATGAGLIVGMERLGAAFDATVVAVTHPGKDSDKGAIGSSLIESLAFAIWRVSLDGEAVFVEVQKMKDGPAEFSVAFKIAWMGKQGGPGGPVPARTGTPVVVEVAPGEQLERASVANDDAKVSEGVRGALAAGRCYGAGAALPEAFLAEQLAGEKPSINDDDARREWELLGHKIAHGLRSARSRRDWTKKICDQRVLTAGCKPVWVWFLPEEDRPVPAAAPSGEPF